MHALLVSKKTNSVPDENDRSTESIRQLSMKASLPSTRPTRLTLFTIDTTEEITNMISRALTILQTNIEGLGVVSVYMGSGGATSLVEK